jgi:hypothetical protein
MDYEGRLGGHYCTALHYQQVAAALIFRSQLPTQDGWFVKIV